VITALPKPTRADRARSKARRIDYADLPLSKEKCEADPKFRAHVRRRGCQVGKARPDLHPRVRRLLAPTTRLVRSSSSRTFPSLSDQNTGRRVVARRRLRP
jgi:hypothetical protein